MLSSIKIASESFQFCKKKSRATDILRTVIHVGEGGVDSFRSSD